MKLEEILHCRTVEESSTSVTGWPGPTTKSFYPLWGFLLAKCPRHLERRMLLSACNGREERCGDPGWFPSSEHPGAKGEESSTSPQQECQAVVAFLLRHQHSPACPHPMTWATYLLLPSIALGVHQEAWAERGRPQVCIFCKPPHPRARLQEGEPGS